MATSTLAQVLQVMADRYGLGRRFTNTGVVATSLTSDADLGGPDAARDLDVGCAVLIDGGTRAGDLTQLSAKPKLSTGLATVDPSFGAALAASSTGIILYKPLRFVGGGYALRDKINEALAQFQWELRRVPITSVPDGDMLATGTTSWSEVGSGALSKVAASFPLGERVLRMTGVAANDYIKSATIPVEPDVSYYLEVLGMISSTGAAADTGTLVLYDETNAASISLDQITIDRFEPEVLANNVTMPSGCKQVTVRLEADNAGDVIDWAYVILRKNSAREFTIADRPQKVLWVGRLLTPALTAWGQRGEWTEVPAELQALDAGLWRYQTEASVSGLSLWYEESVQPASLTSVTDTTQIPVEDLAAVAAELVLQPLRTWGKVWATRYDYARTRAAGVIDRYLEQNRRVVHRGGRMYYPRVKV